jgi:hypothetical protein
VILLTCFIADYVAEALQKLKEAADATEAADAETAQLSMQVLSMPQRCFFAYLHFIYSTIFSKKLHPQDGKGTRISVASSHHSEDHLSAGDAFAR